jgi:hypothetical protein
MRGNCELVVELIAGATSQFLLQLFSCLTENINTYYK